MAPENTLNRIWTEVFGFCVTASVVLMFGLNVLNRSEPYIWMLFLLLAAFVIPTTSVWLVSQLRRQQHRRHGL